MSEDKRRLGRTSSDTRPIPSGSHPPVDDVDFRTQTGVSTVDPTCSEFRIRKGRALIISNNYYGCGDYERAGNEVDRSSMESLLNSIGCDVTIIEDKIDQSTGNVTELTKADIENTIREWSDSRNNYFDNFDCLIIVIMCHGTLNHFSNEEFIETVGGTVSVKWILESFSNNKCKSLLGKPKLFFLQHCRGGKKDRGVILMPNARRTSCDSSPRPKSVAKMSEYFIANASFEGYEAYLTTEGSWFIQEIVKVFSRRIPQGMELHHMMLEVHRNIADIQEREKDLVNNQYSEEPLPDEDTIVKEAPCTKTTLTKPVYFQMLTKLETEQGSFSQENFSSFNLAKPTDSIKPFRETDL